VTPTTADFWDDAANNTDVAEPPKPQFADVPDKAWVLVKNATREHKEGAQPKIQSWEWEGRTNYKFKTAFLVTGGDDKIKPNHVGRYIFFECNAHRHPEKDPSNMPCGGQLYNLILDTLAPVDAPTPERWAKARVILGAKAKEMNMTPDSCNGDTQYLYAVVFKEVLLDNVYSIIGQTYTPKKKEGKTFQPSQTIGSITANMTANRTEKKVRELATDKVAF
jgi:hypothetical protein